MISMIDLCFLRERLDCHTFLSEKARSSYGRRAHRVSLAFYNRGAQISGFRGNIHQSMRKADLGPIDSAIANALKEGQKRRKLRISDQSIQRGLQSG